MTRPTLLVLLIAPDRSHAAETGSRAALCGQTGVPLPTVVRSSFDFTCERCVPLVQDALGLTSMNDPGNAGFVVVDEDES